MNVSGGQGVPDSRCGARSRFTATGWCLIAAGWSCLISAMRDCAFPLASPRDAPITVSMCFPHSVITTSQISSLITLQPYVLIGTLATKL